MTVKTEIDEEMKKVLADAEAALLQVTNWRRDPRENEPSVTPYATRAFVGDAAGWRFVITDFSIEDQGFPPGTRGWDGAAICAEQHLVLHLTRDMAKKGLDRALEQTGGN